MHKVPVERRRYCTGIKRVDDTITAWMVTLLIPVDVNMPMNLMNVGITDAHAISPEIGRHFTFKGKYSAVLHTNHQETGAVARHGFCCALHMVL